MKISKELLKGSTTLLILSVLKQKELYGYQIIKELALLSENVFHLNEGTMYPILHAMEQEKLLESYWMESESGRKRKYYRITQKGLKELKKQVEEWQTYAGTVCKVIGGATVSYG